MTIYSRSIPSLFGALVTGFSQPAFYEGAKSIAATARSTRSSLLIATAALCFSTLPAAVSFADPVSSLSDVADDPANAFVSHEERLSKPEALFPSSPLARMREAKAEFDKTLYDAARLRVTFAYTQLVQGIASAPDLDDTIGTASDFDAFISWDALNPGAPNAGKFLLHFEGRWDWGTTSPQALGFEAGSLINPANAFARYDPTFLPVRNFFWKQGSPEAGWGYRVGYISPDAIFFTSPHLNPNTTFQTIAGTGNFAGGVPDSGFGIAGSYWFNDDVRILVGVHDANAERQDWGDIGEGDFYYAAEIGARLFPRTPDGGLSKFTLWHNDGTSDGSAINASSGLSGWGYYLQHDQELTDDGNIVDLARYGKAFDDSATYDQQAGLSLLFYDQTDFFGVKNDVTGMS